MITRLLLIFFAGLVVEVLTTQYTRYIASGKSWRASLLSGLITVVNFALLAVILKDSAGNDFSSVLVFASGNSLGTFLALKKI